MYLGGNKLLLIVPIGVLAGAGMVALGLVNFENFVFTTIAIRSTLDITKPQAGNTGSAGVGNPTASGLDPAGALAILFILVAFFWLLTRMREGRKSPPASIHRICLILFAGAGFLSIIDSANFTVSLLEAIRVSAVVVMLAVLEVMLVDREMIKKLIASIYVSALIPVGYTMFEVLTHHAQFTSGGFSRFEGTFSQPNPFAIYLTMLIVMGAALFPHLGQEEARHVGAAVLLHRLPLLHLHSQRVDRVRDRSVRSRDHGPQRRLMLGLMVAGIMVSLVALPSIAGRFADLGDFDERRGLFVELAVLAFQLLG